MTLLAEIARDTEAQLTPLRRRYAQLLCANDPKSAAELRTLMVELGKSPGHVEQDLELCKRFDHLRQVIEDGCGLGPKIEAAEKAVRESHENRLRVQQELNEEHRRLVVASQLLDGRRLNADRATHELRELLRLNGDLLGGLDCPDVAAL
jgi:hypothetical protein